ncbi:NrsF family protein [Leptospira venezuelensis]|uniref:NrsF family protein n=1 Tax=Leptospira venezuelensis TaxID=1958811 RepID=UPI000A3BFBA1|nr:NrsF family protein [Leptospira venezuelensis]
MSYSESDKTEKLIQTLSSDLGKGSLNIYTLFVSCLSLVVLGIVLGWSASNLIGRTNAFPGWWPEPILLLVWGIFSAYLLSKLAFPEETSSWVFWAAGGFLLSWTVFILSRFFTEEPSAHVHVGLCSVILATTSIIFGTGAWFILRNMASSRPGLSGFLFLNLLLASSNLGLKFVCPVQDPSHILISHVSFTLVWIALLYFPIRKKFSW